MEEVLLMKSLWCAALAVAVTLGGCGIAEPGTDDLILKDPEIPSVSSARHTSQPESSVSSGAPDTQEKPFPVLPEEYGLLCEAAGLMGDPEASVQTWPVGLDAVRGMRVPDSWELRRSIAALLADADLEKLDSVPEMAASESDPISIQIDLEDQWASIAVSLLSESDAANPGGAYLEVSGSQTVSAADGASSRTDDAAFPDVEAYAGNRVLYEQFAALIGQHTEEVHADFGGKATILRPAPGASETAAIENAMVQIGDILLLGWRDIGQADHYWMLEAHNTDTGGMLYQIPLGERLLTRISPSNAFEQFDYCLFFQDGVLYKNSQNSSEELAYDLPAVVSVAAQGDGRQDGGMFDLSGDRLVWEADDGVWIANQDGSDARLLYANSAIPQTLAPGKALQVVEPRLLCEGGRVVMTIYDSQEAADGMENIGFVVCDADAGSGREPQVVPFQAYSQPQGPIKDRYMVLRNQEDTCIVDAQERTSELRRLPFNPVADCQSYDFETLICFEQQSGDRFAVYRCGADQPDDRSGLLLKGDIFGTLAGVTQQYAVVKGTDADGEWLALADYLAEKP